MHGRPAIASWAPLTGEDDRCILPSRSPTVYTPMARVGLAHQLAPLDPSPSPGDRACMGVGHLALGRGFHCLQVEHRCVERRPSTVLPQAGHGSTVTFVSAKARHAPTPR